MSRTEGAPVASSVRWGQNTPAWQAGLSRERGCLSTACWGREHSPLPGEKLHGSSKGLRSISTSEEGRLPKRHLVGGLGREGAVRDARVIPAWHSHMPPLYSPHQIQGASVASRGLDPQVPAFQTPRLVAAAQPPCSLWPLLIQGLQCHLQ